MLGRRVLVALIPIIGLVSVIGGGFATWYFTTDDISVSAGENIVEVADPSYYGEIIVTNVGKVSMLFNQTSCQLSEPLNVTFEPLNGFSETESLSFTYTVSVDSTTDPSFDDYFLYAAEGTWTPTLVGNIYTASVNHGFYLKDSTLIDEVSEYRDFSNACKNAVFTFTFSVA